MKAIQIFLVGIVIVFLCSINGFAFRCGSGLVTTGDKKVQVTVTCGEPTSKEKVCEDPQSTIRRNKDGKIIKSKKCANKVDVWYYNCGDNDYIYALTFDGNKLVKESTEGKGSGKSDCLGK